MDPTPLINTVSADVMGRWLAIRRLWERWPKIWADFEQKVNQQTAYLHSNHISMKRMTKKITYLSNLALFN